MSVMSRRGFLTAGALSAAGLSGCIGPRLEIPAGIILESDIAYADDHKLQKLDLYYCPELLLPGGNPDILMIHGGLWTWGDKSDSAYPALAFSLAQRGYIVECVNYRLAPLDKWPAMIDDCVQALDWVLSNANGLNIDQSRIGLFGSSAGGQLSALMFSQETTRSRIKANASLFGIYDLNAALDDFPFPRAGAALHHAVFGDCPEAVLAASSPISHANGLSEEYGSNLSIHGTEDWLVDYSQAEEFNARLNESGIDSQLLPFDGTHGLKRNIQDQWPRILEFFEQKLQPGT